MKVDEPLLRRGQLQFNIYCAPCHGNDGYGDGPVHQRAIALQEPKWVPPSNLHDATVKAPAGGHLYNTITNGIRNMAGYGSQIRERRTAGRSSRTCGRCSSARTRRPTSCRRRS